MKYIGVNGKIQLQICLGSSLTTQHSKAVSLASQRRRNTTYHGRYLLDTCKQDRTHHHTVDGLTPHRGSCTMGCILIFAGCKSAFLQEGRLLTTSRYVCVRLPRGSCMQNSADEPAQKLCRSSSAPGSFSASSAVPPSSRSSFSTTHGIDAKCTVPKSWVKAKRPKIIVSSRSRTRMGETTKTRWYPLICKSKLKT